ncbi:nucleoside recognition domain-containing protein [Planococcus shenhongbingii]|uniref:Nucleoside recognition domain-containing protein n=1 Tax=Planococcus shenhongbingii TaxID=3058398 RepID=A0ABT8NHI8_9BACL|nr:MULTISPECIES: nucleoside recognition domain-containing protein [unclassified Planococcus (in: firmicutes)]MDN7247296.1 nucleoside recognition domain-containing protein [Planococcus sp. N017]WKA59681.1 nucleoside recognition domain-containing protein [Planococcus sp. N016]
MSTLKNGLKAGLHTTWTLGKIIFPITLLVTMLQYTPVLPFIIDLVAPIMGIFGLSGDAAIPLVLGNALNLYAGIGGILSLELTVKEVFILAVMLSFSHNIFIETGVALKVGVKLWVVLVVRFGLAALSGIIINLVWKGGGETAKYGFAPEVAAAPESWMGVFLLGLEKASFGILQLAIIVIPLMLMIQILKDKGFLQRISNSMGPLTRLLGIQKNASLTLASGLVFGLAMGAGVMIQAVQEDGVSKKDATLAFIFLVACHAIVEDTLIFVPLGIPIWPLFIIRLVTALVLTIFVSYVWRKTEENRKEVLSS